MRPWLKGLIYVLLVLPATVLLAVTWLVGPYVLDDQRLDAIVMAVALDWRDFGEQKAHERLQFELDHQIGLEIGDDDCKFIEDAEGKHVHCEWGVHVPLPGLQRVVPLSFGSDATITPDGELR